jgi:hypothetical protein
MYQHGTVATNTDALQKVVDLLSCQHLLAPLSRHSAQLTGLSLSLWLFPIFINLIYINVGR